jgi:glycosyltransferase involved in cell wall biosynthesis
VRIGLIARADNSGLGSQTWEFYRHMQPAKTMVVDISSMNHNKQYPERYPDGHFIYGIPTNEDIDTFLQDLDVVFVAEAPYNFYLYTRAKELGVKVAVQYNYEFFDWFATPNLPTPDMLIAPSRWNYGVVDLFCQNRAIKHEYLHCPVDREKLPLRATSSFKTFLHTAGRSAAHDRNGTDTVIQSAQYLKTDAQIIIHFQGEQGLGHQATKTIEQYRRDFELAGGNLIISQKEYDNYQDVYSQGDVLVLPRRYGGNCLPLNEALSSGMPVIMTDIEPNNIFLPPSWLVYADKIGQFSPRTTIDIYDAEPQELARKIDDLYNMSEEEVEINCKIADGYARQISWENMKPMYEKAFEELCQ